MIIAFKEKLKTFVNLLLYFYNLSVALLVKLEDKQKRDAQFKKENPNTGTWISKIRATNLKISYYLGSKKFTLAEQKDLAEILKMSIKFGNAVNQPFLFMSQRNDLRLAVRLKCKQVADELSYIPLHQSLAGKDMLSEEYITLIEVAGRTGDYIPTYESIIESISDKQKRRSVFWVIMIQPILTLVTGIGIEIYVSMSIVPDLVLSIPKEEAPPVLASYIALREILLTHKLEYAIKLSIALTALYGFLKIPATKYLVDLLLMQIPLINRMIAQWEVSKFFDSIHSMIESGASMQESTITALNLINNKVIRTSVAKDLADLGTKTNDLSDILGQSVYVELKIRNQLKIARDSGSDSTDILTSVVEQYKDSMKKLLEAPGNFIIPVMLGSGGLYLFGRLLPLFSEINSFMENIGG